MLQITGIIETCIYVENVERSARFYENLFGFSRMVSDDRFCALAANKQVFLLFLRGGTTQPVNLPGGVIPPHDGSGPMHFAFAIPAEDLAAWEQRLAQHALVIEGRVQWERGGQSIYFRDPDNHLVELVTPGIWPNY